MTEELTIWDGHAKRRAKQVTCQDCGYQWLIRKDRKSAEYCRECRVKGERNPMHGKQPPNYVNGNRALESSEEYRKNQRRDRKKKLILFMGNQCNHCKARNLPICCYHIHHVNEEDKLFAVMSKLNENRFFRERWDVMEQELKKCELLCIHCHKIHHYGDKRAEEC